MLSDLARSGLRQGATAAQRTGNSGGRFAVLPARANAWLDAERRRIATSPIVENRVVRIMSAPAYSATHRATPEQVSDGLKAITQGLDHAFRADDVSLLDDTAFDFSRPHGHRQTTDAYLLAPAVKHGGAVASFVQGVPLAAVRGAARRHLLQI